MDADSETEKDLQAAAELFSVLGNAARLRLLVLLEQQPRTVGALAEASALSQPLVSQHLRTLRSAGLASSTRLGREVRYRIADFHVAHVVSDALAHIRESASASTPGGDPSL